MNNDQNIISKGDIIKTYAFVGEDYQGGGVSLSYNDIKIKLPESEKIPGEKICDGQAVYVYVVSVEDGTDEDGYANIAVTRALPVFVQKLAEEYLPCVKDGSVEIVSVAREAGVLTKIAVRSSEGGANAVKLCRSYDFNEIMAEELYGEKIQFVRYSDDPCEYVNFALLPGRCEEILPLGQKKYEITVSSEQYKNVSGVNLKLASRLCASKLELKISGGNDVPLPEGEERRDGGREKRSFGEILFENKWKIGICLVAILIIAVCVFQSATSKSDDITLLVAGGTYLDGDGKTTVNSILEKYITSDYNDDGTKSAGIVNYLVYSRDEIEFYESKKDENGRPLYYIDRSFNSSEFSSFNSYVQTGEGAVCILSGYLYNELLSGGRLRPLADILKALPENAASEYAIKLSDTKMYAENPELSMFSDDTYVCILRPLVIGKTSKKANYANEVEMFCAIVGTEAK